MPTLFSVLGPIEVRGADGSVIGLPARKPVSVLTTLLLHANAWVGVDTLIDATWPEQAAPASANANLKTYVWHLRRLLPLPRLDQRPGAYRLRVERGELDVDVVERLTARGHDALARGDLPSASVLFTEALGHWRGRPYDGAQSSASAGTLAWLDGLRRGLLGSLADTHAALGRTDAAVAVLRMLLDADPLDEGAWTRWVSVLGAAGRHGEAQAVYQRARAALASELGVAPGSDLTAALRRPARPLLRQLAG